MISFLEAASGSMEPLEKNCVIMFDEMAIDSRLVYDRAQDVVRGPHTQAQVVMVSGFCFLRCHIV